MKTERRFLSATEMRVQKSDAGENVIRGTAVVYNSLSADMGFKETMSPGCFTASLATQPDVKCLYNHSENYVLGRTLAGTLELNDTPTGLDFVCTLPETSFAKDLAISIGRGDVSQCSFAFIADDATWTDTPDYLLRTINTAEIVDVSPVCYPAYASTSVSVSMRSLFPDGLPDNIPVHKEARDMEDGDGLNEDGCACQCDACVSNDCPGCTNDQCQDEACQQVQNDRALASVVERRLR